jgi:hypothetical protein
MPALERRDQGDSPAPKADVTDINTGIYHVTSSDNSKRRAASLPATNNPENNELPLFSPRIA